MQETSLSRFGKGSWLSLFRFPPLVLTTSSSKGWTLSPSQLHKDSTPSFLQYILFFSDYSIKIRQSKPFLSVPDGFSLYFFLKSRYTILNEVVFYASLFGLYSERSAAYAGL
jgi:hypothetical protein